MWCCCFGKTEEQRKQVLKVRVGAYETMLKEIAEILGSGHLLSRTINSHLEGSLIFGCKSMHGSVQFPATPQSTGHYSRMCTPLDEIEKKMMEELPFVKRASLNAYSEILQRLSRILPDNFNEFSSLSVAQLQQINQCLATLDHIVKFCEEQKIATNLTPWKRYQGLIDSQTSSRVRAEIYPALVAQVKSEVGKSGLAVRMMEQASQAVVAQPVETPAMAVVSGQPQSPLGPTSTPVAGRKQQGSLLAASAAAAMQARRASPPLTGSINDVVGERRPLLAGQGPRTPGR